MQLAKRHALIDGAGDATNLVAALDQDNFEKFRDYRLIFRYEDPEQFECLWLNLRKQADNRPLRSGA